MTQRKDGRWVKVITINGTRKSFYSKEPTEKRAEKDIQRQLLAYSEKEAVGISFSDLVYEWQGSHFPNIAYNTKCKYERASSKLIDEFGNTPARQLSYQDVQLFIDSLADKGYARDTVSCNLSVLTQILQYGLRHKFISQNPATNVTIKRGLKKESYPMPTDKEISVIIASRDIPFGLYPYMALLTGLRREELLALTYDDIDFDNQIITINKAIVFEHNRPVISPTKTKASIRDVIIPDDLLAILKNTKTSGYIFPSTNDINAPMTEQMFRRAYKRYQNETGITVTSHSLRHGYATLLYDANIDVKQAQQQLGHSKSSTTMDIYTHIRDSKKQQSADKLNALLTTLK